MISWYVSVMFVVNIYFCGSPSIKNRQRKPLLLNLNTTTPYCFSILSSLLPLFSLNILLKRIECFVISWNSLIHFKFDLCLIFIWSPSIVFELVHCRIHLQRCSWRSWSRKQGRRYTQTPLFYRTVHLLLQLGFPDSVWEEK